MIRVRIGVAVVLCGVLLISACAGEADKTSQSQETPAGTSLPTPVVTPESSETTATPPAACEVDRDAIQIALHDYQMAHDQWPTADGLPGDIDWDKLIPAFLVEVPPTDEKCEWQVASDPEGGVCVLTPC